MHPTHIQADPDPVTPAITLRSAALYLERHGWTQQNYYVNPEADADLFPAACALGAIGMAVHGHQLPCPHDTELVGADDYDRARWVLRDYLLRTGEIPPRTDYSVGDWNDYHEQTADAVIAALREAAADWDRTHGGTR